MSIIVKVGLEKKIHGSLQQTIEEIGVELENKKYAQLKTADIEAVCKEKFPGWTVTGWMILH